MAITYIPVAGLSIKEALINAVRLSEDNKTSVIAIINDIVMNIDANTNTAEALKEYHQKVNLRYYIEQMKRTILK